MTVSCSGCRILCLERTDCSFCITEFHRKCNTQNKFYHSVPSIFTLYSVRFYATKPYLLKGIIANLRQQNISQLHPIKATWSTHEEDIVCKGSSYFPHHISHRESTPCFIMCYIPLILRYLKEYKTFSYIQK